jgi:hypothetical protein
MIETAKIIGAVVLVIVIFYGVVAVGFGVTGWIRRGVRPKRTTPKIKRDH